MHIYAIANYALDKHSDYASFKKNNKLINKKKNFLFMTSSNCFIK